MDTPSGWSPGGAEPRTVFRHRRRTTRSLAIRQTIHFTITRSAVPLQVALSTHGVCSEPAASATYGYDTEAHSSRLSRQAAEFFLASLMALVQSAVATYRSSPSGTGRFSSRSLPAFQTNGNGAGVRRLHSSRSIGRHGVRQLLGGNLRSRGSTYRRSSVGEISRVSWPWRRRNRLQSVVQEIRRGQPREPKRRRRRGRVRGRISGRCPQPE